MAVFYPEASGGANSGDGLTYRYAPGDITWANLIAGAGTIVSNSGSIMDVGFTKFNGIPPQWGIISRCIFTIYFPTAISIPSAVFSLYGEDKLDPDNVTPDINIYSADPASDNVFITADHLAFGGSIPYCDTPISYADWKVDDYNDFILNAAGLEAISTPGVFRVMARNANYDVAEIDPEISVVGAWGAVLYMYSADKGGTYRPKLTVIGAASNQVDQSIIGNKVTLEAIRNLEMQYGGKSFISKSGIFNWQSRYHRNV